MVKAASNDFATNSDWTPATGDVTISKNGGTAANIGTLPSYVNGAWEFQFTATELQAAYIWCKVVDAATKAVEDQFFIIETFGNASAAFQVDWSNATSLGLTNLDAAISSRSTYAGGAVASVTGNVGGNVTGSVGSIASNGIVEASFAADTAKYQAKIWLVDDNTGTTDRYNVVWFKNGQPITAGITSPTIQVIKSADGADLVASTSMTEIASTGLYRYTEGTNRVVNGAGYIVKVTATIDSGTRTWFQPLSRDS
jgi:hypothetical protein